MGSSKKSATKICAHPCFPLTLRYTIAPVLHGPEDIMIAEHLWTVVGEDIQYGDFGSNHSLFYDPQAEDTQIAPRHVLLHPLKAPGE